MPRSTPLKPTADDRRRAGRADEQWLIADLEAAQRANVYAAGRGDGPERTSRRWSLRRGRRAERQI